VGTSPMAKGPRKPEASHLEEHEQGDQGHITAEGLELLRQYFGDCIEFV
jgi:hypothetical protein